MTLGSKWQEMYGESVSQTLRKLTVKGSTSPVLFVAHIFTEKEMTQLYQTATRINKISDWDIQIIAHKTGHGAIEIMRWK